MSTFAARYVSPLGEILLTADESSLTGLWFDSGRYAPRTLSDAAARETPALTQTMRWLEIYFSGREPDFLPPLCLRGTPFRQEVWALLRQIPYGQTTTYGALARRLAAAHGLTKMSAQAVGGAVGHNEISIIIPCHRVVGAHGSLVGYGGGLDKKTALLALEDADVSRAFEGWR